MDKRTQVWTTPSARFAEAALRERFARLLVQAGLCLSKCGVDEVHDLRVSIRRFSQALRVFSPLLAERPARKMRKALHPVMQQAARVRDLDVGLEHLLREGLAEHDSVVEEMQAERRNAELALRGRLLLLQSVEPERYWPAGLRVNAVAPGRPAAAADRSSV